MNSLFYYYNQLYESDLETINLNNEIYGNLIDDEIISYKKIVLVLYMI